MTDLEVRFIEFEKHTDVDYASPLQLKIADDAGDDQAKLDDPRRVYEYIIFIFYRCPFRFAVTGMQVNATQTIVIASHEVGVPLYQ